MNIEYFGHQNRLELEYKIREHESKFSHSKYYCYFKKVEIKDGAILLDEYGNGMTQEEALNNYTKIISGKTLVYDVFGKR